MFERGFQPWKLLACIAVAGVVVLAAATDTFRLYHWFLLLAIPGVVVAGDRGRNFVVGWAPLFLFWFAYDRLRLVQPFLLDRVAVAIPYAAERALFGWLGGGEAPANAAHAWLAAHSGTWAASGIVGLSEALYVSHIVVYPALFLLWWWRGLASARDRERFERNVRAFTVLNLIGLTCYVLLPAAPPWWITLYGTARPTAALVAGANLGAAMDGEIIRRTIATAPQWFAAIPSLHGGYPVLLFLANRRTLSRGALAAVALYGAGIWAATVLLNQHYIVDLIAGALAAAAAHALLEWIARGDAGAETRVW